MSYVHFYIKKYKTLNTHNIAYYLFEICTQPNCSIFYINNINIRKKKVYKNSNFSYKYLRLPSQPKLQSQISTSGAESLRILPGKKLCIKTLFKKLLL